MYRKAACAVGLFGKPNDRWRDVVCFRRRGTVVEDAVAALLQLVVSPLSSKKKRKQAFEEPTDAKQA
jgi:hypothetical protein